MILKVKMQAGDRKTNSFLENYNDRGIPTSSRLPQGMGEDKQKAVDDPNMGSASSASSRIEFSDDIHLQPSDQAEHLYL